MLPAGFQYNANCDPTNSPQYVGGVLVRQPDQAMRYLGRYPRWTLYYGPFETQPDAVDFDSQMWLWARANGWDWTSDLYCIFPNVQSPWPRFTGKYDWIHENAPPPRMAREYSATSGYRIVPVG